MRKLVKGAALALVGVLALVGAVTLAVLVWLAATGGSSSAPAAPLPDPAPAESDPAAPRGLAGNELWLSDMDLTGARVVTPDTDLRDVRMAATDVLIGAGGLRAGTLTVEAVVPFEVVAAGIGPDAVIEPAGSRARITRTVDVLGQPVRLSATGTVRAVDGQVRVEPTSIDLGPAPGWVESLLGDGARGLVTIQQDVEGLPEELVLRQVSVAPTGFAVTLTGRDVPLG